MSNENPFEWSLWRSFPDPRQGGILHAPLGPGVYEIRLRPPDGTMVLVGISGHVARRMTSLLPAPLGVGTRNASDKRSYVLERLRDIEYRTRPSHTREEAAELERGMLRGGGYLFNR